MSDSIKVAIKVRPLIKRELDEGLPVLWTVQGNFIAPVDPELRKRGEGGFQFDHIFDSSQTNQDLFDTVAKPIIDAALNGVNGTIFAYGQTSSGKTYSMMGNDESPGVIPMAVDYIFDTIDKTYGREFLLRISYIEIYNERVNDLLDKERTDLKIKEDPKSGQIKIPAKEEIINSPAKVLAVMKQGDRNRRTGETNMNERSSRSHTIFRITIESGSSNNDSEGATVNVSQLNLVDLAGSERARQTGATGERFNEGRHINLSLSSLGLVIKQLSESQDNPQKFVNFRDSKLTRILQNSLGGNAMTTIICAITPAALEETQCTLAFASRAKHVKNKPRVNEDPSDAALLKRYAKQIAKLKAELKKVTSTDVVEMESKLKEKEHANRLLEERIELLKKSIVCASNPTDVGSFNRCAKRRRTWAGSGTFTTKAPLQKTIGLPTINELDKTPEKAKQEQFKRRQSIFQTLDMANQTFQTEFADFELELIESENARRNNTRFDCSSVSDEDLCISRRPLRNVQFKDDISVIDTSFRNVDASPERRRSRESTNSDSASPGTPKIVLRNRVAFLVEEYNALHKEHRTLEEFTTLEKQLIVEDALEAAMAEYNKMFEASEKKCQEITEKYTKLESRSSAADKRVAELEQQLAESASALKALQRENQVLIDEANGSAAAKPPRVEPQTTNNEKETSSIFANASYFEELDVSDGSSSQCESMLINDTIQDNSLANVTASRLDESKRSKERTNAAAYSEFVKGIAEKSSSEIAAMMQELINARLVLEDENANFQSQLRRRIREADDVKNDIRELKSGIEKLQETIHLLTVENTDLTSKLSAEKQNAKESEKNLQNKIAELNLSISAITEEKTLLESSVKELEEELKKAERRQSVVSTDEEMRAEIARCQKTIASLTAENEELSSNLMSKIEELDQTRDSKLAGEHECVYRELSINLADRNKLLEFENIELSNNLMDKIEEYDRVKEELEGFTSKLSASATPIESSRLIEILDNSRVETAESVKNEKPTPTVDDLLRLSMGTENSLPRGIAEPRKNGLGSPITNGNGAERSVDDLLEIPLVADGSPNGSNESAASLAENAWKTKAELLQEQVNQLSSLNDKLSELKITSCAQCAHLAQLNENRKSLKLEAKTLNRKLQELQDKFDRECADSALLRTKASEDLNLSVCDLTLNGSMMHDGNLNISFVEEKVQALNHELEALRDKHDRLADLYREKCDEIDKLQDIGSRESTPTPTTPSAVESSSRAKRGDEKLERIQTDMEKLRSDFRSFKKNIAGISAALQRFVNEKTTMQAEIDSLRAERAANLSGAAESTEAEERIAFLEDRVTQLDREIDSSKLLARQMESEKDSLEAEVKSLRAERATIEEKMRKTEDISTGERMSFLENEVERLGAEIAVSNSVKAELESVKSSLEAEVESLRSERSHGEKSAENTSIARTEFLEDDVARLKIHSSNLVTRELENFESALGPEEASSFEDPTDLGDVSMTQETMKYLEDEVSRLSDEINHSNVVKEELVSTKCTLEAEVQSLKAEEIAFDVKITQTEGTSAQERINLLEKQVARLNDEIGHSNEVKEELESAKSSLEAEVQYLKVERASRAEEHASTAQERITALETEVIRLSDEIDGSSELNRQAESAKSSLEAEIEALKAECKAREESIRDLQKSVGNLETDNSTLLITLKKLTSEKDQLVEKIAKNAQVEGDSSNNNDQDFAKIVESLELKLKETNKSLENYVEVNRELNIRLTTLRASEDEFAADKSRLEDEIAALRVERTEYEESLATLRESLKRLEETNVSTLSRISEAETSLKASVTENAGLKDKLKASERFEEELSDARLEITSLKAEVVDLRENNSSLSSELENERILRAKDSESIKASERSEEELADARLEITSLKAEIVDLRENNSALSSELENERILRAKDSESKIDEPSYQTLKEYERMVEELRTKVQDITSDLHTNAKETAELNDQLTKLNSAKDELNNARCALESEVTRLKTERDGLEETLTALRRSLDDLEARNACLNQELENLKAEKEKVVEAEKIEKAVSSEIHEKAISEMNARVEELTAELNKCATENEELSGKVAELRRSLEEANAAGNQLANSSRLTSDKHVDELEAARDCITKEIKSLKPSAASRELVEEQTISELFALFVRTIMSKEQEIIKALGERFERDTRKLEEQNRQSCDAEKRATIWAKELEAEVERTQQDLAAQETKATELKSQIAKLENLLKESAHENQLLNEKMQVLELDFNSLQAELDKQQRPETKENVTLNSPQERERLVEDALQTREMELSAKLRLVEKQSKEKLQELTKSVEFYKTKYLEMKSNFDGLEANERQLRSIADMKSNELIKCTATIERLQVELEQITESHNSLTTKHAETARQVEEITAVLKTKCDMLSEYKTKLETITPEYEHLKDQAAERQARLEKYKGEIECLTTTNEREISALRDLLDSAQIESAGCRKQLAEATNRNTQLQTEIAELRAKCEELERANAKLMKSMRNSTSKIRAEEEMEDLRDENRTLQRNLEGASNRIADLQDMKTQMLKELVDLRGKYETTCNEHAELKIALSHHKASVEETIELRGKYESLMQEKNRVALELEGKKSELLHLENKHRECAKEIETLRATNKELDEEMDDMVQKIEELRTENGQLDNKLYAIESSGALEETNRLRAQVEKLQSEIKSLEAQRDQERGALQMTTKMLESLRNENTELGARAAHHDRGDSLSCDSSRSASPALVEAARVDNRRRRSRTELFNQKRQLGIFEPNEQLPCCGVCRCSTLRDEVTRLEHELVSKNGEIASMEIRIQSENFPHMKRCKDLEEFLASSRRKCKQMEAELHKIRDLKVAELSSECAKCRHWKANKRDQSSQCLPNSEQIYLSGISSGVVEDHIKLTKLQKTNDWLKDLCRGRQRKIFELQSRLAELENGQNTKLSNDDEKSNAPGASTLSVNAKTDSAVNSRQ